MADEITGETKIAANAAESKPSATPNPSTVSEAPLPAAPPVVDAPALAVPRAPEPGAAPASTVEPIPQKPTAIERLPPLPGPIYAPIPPRAPLPPPLPSEKPLPAAATSPAQPMPKPVAHEESIVFAPPSGSPDAPLPVPTPNTAKDISEVTGADVGLATNITKILKEVQMPERRDAGNATQNPALQETALTNAPYRATTQLDASKPSTDVPSALELTLAQNKLAIPEEEGIPIMSEERSPVVSLHTMKTDFQQAARQDKISVIRAASMAADKRAARGGAPRQTDAPTKGRFRTALLILTTTILLLALGAAALYAVYYLQTAKPAASTQNAIGLLFAEQQTLLPIDGQSGASLKQTIQKVMTKGGVAGTIVQIIPTVKDDTTGQQRHATFGEFLRALGAHPSDEFVRSFSDDFFFGIHFADTPSPVFVVPVTSHDHAFAGMLTWEKTIDTELGGLFVQLSPFKAATVATLMASTTAPGPAATSTGTSTVPAAPTAPSPTMQDLLPSRTFEDLVMRNYDVRVLKDDSGTIVLYYSFPTQNILIISASPYTFPEALSRLQAARKL